MSRIRILGMVAGACFLLGACTSAVKLDEKQAGGNVTPPMPNPHPACCINPEHDTLNDPGPGQVQRSIYFGFDEYTVKDEFRAALEAHSKYLREHPKRVVALEGNTDKRGGREYNLALGQKRAEAVLNMMTLMGVPAQQVQAISFGAEKPKAEGDSETAWAENRRVDLQY